MKINLGFFLHKYTYVHTYMYRRTVAVTAWALFVNYHHIFGQVQPQGSWTRPPCPHWPLEVYWSPQSPGPPQVHHHFLCLPRWAVGGFSISGSWWSYGELLHIAGGHRGSRPADSPDHKPGEAHVPFPQDKPLHTCLMTCCWSFHSTFLLCFSLVFALSSQFVVNSSIRHARCVWYVSLSVIAGWRIKLLSGWGR